MRSLRSFIIESAAISLYRELIKTAPAHVREEWIMQVRSQFELNRNADED